MCLNHLTRDTYSWFRDPFLHFMISIVRHIFSFIPEIHTWNSCRIEDVCFLFSLFDKCLPFLVYKKAKGDIELQVNTLHYSLSNSQRRFKHWNADWYANTIPFYKESQEEKIRRKSFWETKKTNGSCLFLRIPSRRTSSHSITHTLYQLNIFSTTSQYKSSYTREIMQRKKVVTLVKDLGHEVQEWKQ